MLVTHLVCPEHGEVIHADPSLDRQHASDTTQAPAGHKSAPDSTQARAGYSSAQAQDVSHDHDVCVFCGSEQELAMVTDGGLDYSAATASLSCENVFFQTRGLYRTAPKTSPPA
ncbi:MAG: hypothetical protein R3C68_07300 [Myxococcota bacterium]